MSALAAMLEQEQAPTGAFRSWVRLPGGNVVPDGNGFLTALVLRELGPVDDERLEAVVGRACQFLLRCRAARQPGTFTFWPEEAYPSWMGPTRLYPDADDTAVATMQLVARRVLPREALQGAAAHVVRYRGLTEHVRAPWQREGAFLTWLFPGLSNRLDCCVNANVVALLAQAGLRESDGYRAAVEMIVAAVELQVDPRGPGADLTPYYADPAELGHAMDWAVQAGATELADAAGHLAAHLGKRPAASDRAPVCSSVDGRFVWNCPALQRLRRARRESGAAAVEEERATCWT